MSSKQDHEPIVVGAEEGGLDGIETFTLASLRVHRRSVSVKREGFDFRERLIRHLNVHRRAMLIGVPGTITR